MNGTIALTHDGRVPMTGRATIPVAWIEPGRTHLVIDGRPQVVRRIDPYDGPFDAVGIAVCDTAAMTLFTHVTVVAGTYQETR